jgi:hypothetical protein
MWSKNGVALKMVKKSLNFKMKKIHDKYTRVLTEILLFF